MYLDYFTLAALVDELQARLGGGRIQDVLDVDETSLGLEIYANRKRHWLTLSADQRYPRLLLQSERLRRGLERPLPIGLLLRRHVEGGRLTQISQPPWERVVLLDVAGPEGAVRIIVEPMERRSNILLVQDGVILECLRRVHASENRMRTSLPAQPYAMPPPQRGRHDPLTLQQGALRALLTEHEDAGLRTHQLLSRRLLGVSPLLAREAVHRSGAAGSQRAQEADATTLLSALRSILEPLAAREWQPGLAGDATNPAAFSVYPLQSVPGWRSCATVTEALAAWYGARTGAEAYQAAKRPVAAALDEARKRLEAQQASMQRSLKDEGERARLRQSGELLLAWQYALRPGQRELRAQYEPEGPELVIALDEKLTPLENAQRYFQRHEKAKRALKEVPRLLRQTKARLRTLEQLRCDLELAGSRPEIDEVQAALQAPGLWRGPGPARSGGERSAPLRLVSDGGFVILVGRNSRQNEQVTFGGGAGDDLWLHARAVPGAHVIVRTDGRPVPDDVVEEAAALAAWFSPQRHESRAPVDVTRRRHVRRIRGAGPGVVSYRHERTLAARPRLPDNASSH